MAEEWLPICNFEGFYEVSNMGRVKSLPRNGTVKILRIMKPSVYSEYAIYTLHKRGHTSYRKGHRLVAEAFIPNPCNKPEVNHIDGNKLNNCVSNLEWVTARENLEHSFYVLGNKQPNVEKPVVQYNHNMLKVKIWKSINQAAKHLGICSGDICRCCKNIRKTAGGYCWKYYRGVLDNVERM